MSNYFYGIATAGLVMTIFDMIDTQVPNGLWYYVNLYAPF